LSRLVLVSNRVALPKRGAAPGGLAVGLQSAATIHGGIWFGWSGKVSSTPAGPDAFTRHGVRYATLDLSPREYDDYYLGYSNGVLWPIFHDFLDRFRFSDALYAAYQSTNQRLAGELLRLIDADDRIWVHDYHLIPFAQNLRALGCTARLGFFLHIPFPQLEVLRALPVHDELLQQLLAYDVIGFQTETDRHAFRDAVQSLWGKDAIADADSVRIADRRVTVGVYPIGVDVDAIRREADATSATEPCQRMRASLLGRRLILGVDRLDYSKGLIERFTAYERFLESHPEQQDRVTILQIAPLSRSDVRAYAEIRTTLENTAGRINGRLADTDWTPIRYLNRNFPHDVLMGFLRLAQVAVVTPLRDGMNLVAKEFIAAQDPEDPGVLVLSALAGAARQLTKAIIVNPYDTCELAHAMQAALSMPLAERRERHGAMLEELRRNDIHAWCRRFLADLGSQ
jgi:trehalose 6-phosphate synthase